MFPSDAITVFKEYASVGTSDLVSSGTNTILHISIIKPIFDADAYVKCGSTFLAEASPVGYFSSPVLYPCVGSAITASRLGSSNVSYIITYVPRIYSYISTASAQIVDFSPASNFSQGIYDIFSFFFMLSIIIVLYIGWRFGIWLYRR